MNAESPIDREFLSMEEAERIGRFCRRTLRKGLRRVGAPTFVDPANARRRLIRRDDFARLLEPYPAADAGTEGAASRRAG